MNQIIDDDDDDAPYDYKPGHALTFVVAHASFILFLYIYFSLYLRDKERPNLLLSREV